MSAASAALLARLEQALAEMPALTCEILLAHRLDLLSYQQIATRTGLSVAKVEQHIARGMAHIDRALRARM